jgi:hypothetical protein
MQVSRAIAIVGIASSLVATNVASLQAGSLPEEPLWGSPTCALSKEAIATKRQLLKDSLTSESAATQYNASLDQHKAQVKECRDRTWPQTQAVWLRLYAHDAKPGVLAEVMDRIVNRGYNQVFVEVFYDGRVLLPVADNPTPWRSVTAEAVKAGKVSADYDIWADAVKKGQERGLKVYGWSFALNFGYSYSERSDRATALALNGQGETSIARSKFDPKEAGNGRAFYFDAYEPDHLFADPYSAQARADLSNTVRALMKRQPDGMVFDYVRYPTTYGRNSLITNVKQLWIYGTASQKALFKSIPSDATKRLMALYLQAGRVTPSAIASLWNVKLTTASQKQDAIAAARMSEDLLWRLASDHAYKGVLGMVEDITHTLRKDNVPTGAVFFPGGNYQSTSGYDARMQPWDRFPNEMERHPMTYAICDDGKCVAQEVSRVLSQSSPQTLVCPVLAGTWGQSFGGHPSFETQMQAIRATTPKISCISHFVYAWMEPDSDKQRKAGKTD